MSDFKSKLPDLKEVTGMLGKLFGDVKKSVIEIADAYKEKHPNTEEETVEKPAKDEQPKAKAAPKTAKPEATEAPPKDK